MDEMTARYEMLSDEELKSVIANPTGYSSSEIACVQGILAKRSGKTIQEEVSATFNVPFPNNSVGQREENRDIEEVKRDLKAIKGYLLFFVVLASVGIISTLIFGFNLMSAVSKLSGLIK